MVTEARYQPAIEYQLKAIQESKGIRPKNKALISRWPVKGLARGQGPGRVAKTLWLYRCLGEMADFDLETGTREDVERLVARVKGSSLREWTKHDHLLAIKMLYKHLVGDGEVCPPAARWVKVEADTRDLEEQRMKGTLTPEEINKLVDAATDIRLKAFIRFLYESGARIGEALNMRIGDIRLDDNLVDVTLSGKTGSRVISVFASVPLLVRHLETHPQKNDPTAFLWYSLYAGNKAGCITGTGITKKVREAARTAGIRKPVNPHSFRHARATHLSGQMTSAELCQYFGWRQGSDMPATYFHRTPEMLKGAIRRIHGLEKPQQKTVEKPHACERCGKQNDAMARFCDGCGLPFSYKEAITARAQLDAAAVISAELEKNPLFIQAVEAAAKKSIEQLLSIHQKHKLDELDKNLTRKEEQ